MSLQVVWVCRSPSYLIAGFKQVQAAASLVKKCKKVVEHIKSSTPSSYLLVKYQEPLELPLHRVLTANSLDTSMIQNMKSKMLAKMKTRYSSDQMKILTTCTLLDIRYESTKYLANDFDQHVNPPTQGQEWINLSFEGNSSNDASIFDFEDDSFEDSQIIEIDTLKNEITVPAINLCVSYFSLYCTHILP